MKRKARLADLDPVIGLELFVLDDHLDAEVVLGPGTFFVRESIDWDSLAIGNDGHYAAIELTKSGVDTLAALEALARAAGVPAENLIALGLKDASATAIQYVFARKGLVERALPLEAEGVRARLIGYVSRKPRRAHMLGNEFAVYFELDPREEKRATQLIDELSRRGLPAYYGYQRFGVQRPITHILGKHALTGREELFVHYLMASAFPLEGWEGIESRISRSFRASGLRYERLCRSRRYGKCSEAIERALRGLCVDAFQAYAFNLLLNKLARERGLEAIRGELPSLGCRSEEFQRAYSELLRAEGVDPGVVKDPRLRCWQRKGIFRPERLTLTCGGGTCKLSFSLERGMYATILLRELFRDGLAVEL
ncbi:MAG: tRNA pseudouridine(13) synthase TruD [Desulfurococcaceae archaeon]